MLSRIKILLAFISINPSLNFLMYGILATTRPDSDSSVHKIQSITTPNPPKIAPLIHKDNSTFVLRFIETAVIKNTNPMKPPATFKMNSIPCGARIAAIPTEILQFVRFFKKYGTRKKPARPGVTSEAIIPAK